MNTTVNIRIIIKYSKIIKKLILELSKNFTPKYDRKGKIKQSDTKMMSKLLISLNDSLLHLKKG